MPPSPEANPSGTDVPYEDLLAGAERLAGQLEQGALPLEKALEAYTEAMRLLRACGERLRRLEEQARLLAADGDGWRLDPLDPAEG